MGVSSPEFDAARHVFAFHRGTLHLKPWGGSDGLYKPANYQA
jgi:hypothetical protein